MTLVGDSVTDFMLALVVVAVSVYSVGANAPGDRAVRALALVIALVIVVNVEDDATGTGDYVFPISVFAAAWALGRLVQSRGDLTSELEARHERLERERDELATAAVADERARIARELHDVVAHSLRVDGRAGRRRAGLLDPRRREAAEALRAVERTGREALGGDAPACSTCCGRGRRARRDPQPSLRPALELSSIERAATPASRSS